MVGKIVVHVARRVAAGDAFASKENVFEEAGVVGVTGEVGLIERIAARVQEGLVSQVEVELGAVSISGIPTEALGERQRTIERKWKSAPMGTFRPQEKTKDAAYHGPSAEGRKLARDLTNKLVSDDRALAYRYSPNEKEIYLTDVHTDVENFLRAKHCLSKYGLKFPCLNAPSLRGPIPIFLGLESNLFAAAEAGMIPNDLLPRVCDAIIEYTSRERRISLDPEAHVEMTSVKDAEDQFRSGLQDFLSVRFDARQSDVSAGPGHQFFVHTISPGLVLHISPAYAINPYLKFGNGLSTPVTQFVQPGRWIFGAPQLDTTTMYDVPVHNTTHINK